MQVRCLMVLFLCGCSSVPAPQSPEQRALDSCFFRADQNGWSVLKAAPINAGELKAIIPAGWKSAAALEDGYQQLWFRHTDGRMQVCSLFAMGDLPAVCSKLKYEFVQSTNGWIARPEPPVVCY